MPGHKHTLQKKGKMVCVYMGFLAFSYLLQVVCMHVCVYVYIRIRSVTCVSGLVMHGCLLLLNETNLKLLFTER